MCSETLSTDLLKPYVPVRKSGFRNQGNFCLLNPESHAEIWVGQPGIQPKESGIPLTIGIRNLSSTGKKLIIQSSVSLRDQESTAWNPESKTVLDSFTWGDTGHVPHFVHLYIFLTRQCILCRIRRYSYNYFILFSRDDRYWNKRKIRFGRCNCLSAIDFGIDRTK